MSDESAIKKARARLEKAALVVGKHFDEETDARWPECVEFEAAALEFYRATKAAQP